ncbi:N-acetylmuramoyl-L-alanine amidase [Luteolibacter arcticus]|uniref:N-acetylmuramoyl-L-alanine amidase n=1 Tax=Luteolibacter arcticus TaxID=1581411 RepID=A0ABT3GMR4_9BACT|nr:N-acetylmuramoyl-L-alanine amidase [Luteolibacter arcticus]MCW1924789.1 N-acetylmuramoyl-L-alanine amidase [Luteolibacter arcticus]
MTSRSAPLWIVLFVALAAALWWWKKPVAPLPPPGPIPPPPALSDLAGIPDWASLNRYQSTITRADFLRLMDQVFTVSPAWRDWIEVGEDDAKIRTNDGEFLRLRFAPEGLASPPPRYWRAISELPPAPPDRPLAGLKIAIDPGHIGGRWGKMEERWFQIPGSLPVQEGDMTLQVAKLLKPKLEALGATVTMVRNETEPVTPIRPEMLQDEARTSNTGGNIARLAERLFYRTAEIRARAKLVNDTLKPDLVLCLHFNADEWGDPASPTLVPANHFHMILNGGYTDDEVALADQRHDLLEKLLQGIHDEERKLAASAADAFVEKSGMPPYLYNPAAKNHRNVDGNPYLWARNLLANRIYQCPVVYFEPYVMNSTEDHARIQAGDYEGEREVWGKLRPSIFREYADCVALGLKRYFQARPRSE